MNGQTAIRRWYEQSLAWLPILLLPSVVFWAVPHHWPRWLLMWLVAGAIYAGCKWLTWATTAGHSLRKARNWGYLLAWPGLDAPTFLSASPLSAAQLPSWSEWGWAGVKFIAGLLLFLIAAGQAITFREHLDAPLDLAIGWLGMASLVLCLHCGLFHLLSCAWRAAGVDARPIMNGPLSAHSLSNFWGRRWNTAFRDLAHRFVFAPANKLWGPRWAVAAGFLFSGLVHDAVISLPAGGGYGGPTLFFAVQGVGLLAERRCMGRGEESDFQSTRWRDLRGRGLTILLLLAPAGLLFHSEFVRGIVLPMLRDVAGLLTGN